MAKTKQQKEAILLALKEKMQSAKGAVFFDFTGLNVPDTEILRHKCREEKIDIMAIKKSLLRKIMVELGFGNGELNFDGSIAVAIGVEDEVAPAKVINNFAKTHEVIQFRGGVLEHKLIDAATVSALAALPSKLELYTKVVGSLNAPISGIVNVLAGNLRGLVNVLSAIKDNK